MSITVRLIYLGDNQTHVTALFRGIQQDAVCRKSNIKGESGSSDEHQFTWSLDSSLHTGDSLTVRVFEVDQLNPERNTDLLQFLGFVIIDLTCLLDDPRASLHVHLLEENGKELNSSIKLSFEYEAIMQTEKNKAVFQKNHFISFNDEEELKVDEDESRPNFLTERDSTLPIYIDSGPAEIENFRICINIIEARELYGSDINPIFEVVCGTQKRYTKVSPQTNNPFYNDYFVFEMRMSKNEILQQLITIRAFSMKNIIDYETIGEFSIDLQTLYQSKDHSIFRKWISLTNPKKPAIENRGYVYIDLEMLCSTLLHSKTPRVADTDEKTNIETNLLVPATIGQCPRKLYKFSVLIYQAEELPSMNTNLVSSLQRLLLSNHKPLTNPFVEVSCGGFTGQTNAINHTDSPEWNQQIIFKHWFPSFFKTIKITVRHAGVLQNETIATVIIDLDKIMDTKGNEEELSIRSYGPCWLNLYGAARSYSYLQLLKPDQDKNENLAEGVAFRGRLKIAIKTLYAAKSSKVGVRVKPCYGISENITGMKDRFLLYATVYEASFINAQFGNENRPISFEISMGYSKMDSCENHSRAELAQQSDKNYYHISYGNKKPCMCLTAEFEDHRPRMFIPNIVERLKHQMSECIRQTNYRLGYTTEKRMELIFLNAIMEFIESIDRAIIQIKSCKERFDKTMNDVKYKRFVLSDLERIKIHVKSFVNDETGENLSEKLSYCQEIVALLDDQLDNQQHCLPDVFIYMVQNTDRVAYARIKARNIIHSITNEGKGRMCGRINTIYFKKLETSLLFDEIDYKIAAQLRTFLWLGLEADINDCKSSLPEGYNNECFIDSLLPRTLDCTIDSRFQLRIYILMARNLMGIDECGLLYPFVKVYLAEQEKKTAVFYGTCVPIWNETLIIDNIVFNYPSSITKSSPPHIIVEIFNCVFDVEEEFLGRAFCQPNVHINDDKYTPAKFQWWKLFYGNKAAGDILAAFDLIEIDVHTNEIAVSNLPTLNDLISKTSKNVAHFQDKNVDRLRIPFNIKFKLKTYRFELILFGFRHVPYLERHKLYKPQILVEFLNYVFESDEIGNWNIQPNFKNNLLLIDMKLPENKQFWPPITIRCMNTLIFGRKICVGRNTITNIEDFIHAKELKTHTISQNVEIEDNTIAGIVEIVDEENSSSQMHFNKDNLEHDKASTNADINQSQSDKDNIEFYNKEKDIASEDNNSSTEFQQLKIILNQSEHDDLSRNDDLSEIKLNVPDWWTRYFASIDDTEEGDTCVPEYKSLAKSESDGPSTMVEGKPSFLHVNNDDDEEDDVIEIIHEIPKRKRKQKRTKRKSVCKRRKIVFRQYKSTDQIRQEFKEHQKKKNGSETGITPIEKITIYSCELENVEVYNQFSHPVRSFPLYGINIREIIGYFKGNLAIYEIDSDQVESVSEKFLKDSNWWSNKKLKRSIKEIQNKTPSISRLYRYMNIEYPLLAIVRVYIIKAINLRSNDKLGTLNPYLSVRLGDQEIRDNDLYAPQTLNPIFGKCFEFKVSFPRESILLVQVFDKAKLFLDDLIGETTIDLENRWLSCHRGTCGLMPTYHSDGVMAWKDCQLPSVILKSLCEKHGVEFPKYDLEYGSVSIRNRTFTVDNTIRNNDGSILHSIESLALKILQNWDDIVPGCKLVPEHIETRPLYLPEKPNVEQGLLHMWVDMFPTDGIIPPAIDISPPQPISYMLKVTIKKIDLNFYTSEKCVHIYFKSWMESPTYDLVKADVIYRSLEDLGGHNWNILLPFDYLKHEDKILHGPNNLNGETVMKTSCCFNMQMLESDVHGHQSVIGQLRFKLSQLPEPATEFTFCKLLQYSDRCHTIDLFKCRKIKGWWPVIYNPIDREDSMENGQQIISNVKMEIELLDGMATNNEENAKNSKYNKLEYLINYH